MANDLTKSLRQIGLEKGLSQGEVTALLQDHEGFIWIGTYQGLNLYDGYEVRQIQSEDKTLQVHHITSLYQDNNNLIWVGTSPDRNFVINKLTGEIREVNLQYPDKFNVIDSAVRNIVAGNNNDLWLASFQAVFNIRHDTINIDRKSVV